MKKIISLFKRDYNGTRQIYDEIVEGAEWVTAGEGIPTRKYDGTCCMVRDGKLYKRYDVKKGKPPPPGFEAVQDPDEVTGHCPGWLPVGDGSEDKWHREAFAFLPHYPDGTYELCGPKVQGNPERFDVHMLIPHGTHMVVGNVPRKFEGLKEWFKCHDIEGIVWHHDDGRMVKIKGKDFGLKRSPL